MKRVSISQAHLVGAVLLALPAMVVIGSGVARAQPSMTAASPPSNPAVAHEPPPAKSVGTALALELGVAAGGVGLLFVAHERNDDGFLVLAGLGALVVSPSMGHFYVGDTGRGLVGTGLRLAGGLTGILGFACGLDETGDCDKGLAPTMLLGGAALFLGGTLYSIIDTPLAVRRANAARGRQIAVVPGPVRGPGSSSGPGMHVHLRF